MSTNRFPVLDPVTRLDTRSLLWVVSGRYHRTAVAWARAISHTGDGYLHLLLPLLCYAVNPAVGYHFAILVIVAFAIERPVYWVLKNGLKRPRPPAALPRFKSAVTASDEFSFPSGHTAAATLLATLAISVYGIVALPLAVWAALVGVSRVVLGVHFPTDIAAGAALGYAIAQFAVGLVA